MNLKEGTKSPLLFVYPMVKQELEIKRLAEELVAEKPGFFLVDLLISGTQNRKKIVVILDTDAGILIDECGTFSRELSDRMDAAALIDNAYTLEVSSPGIDRPLTVKRQYARRIGNKLNFILQDGTTFEALLQQVNEEGVNVLPVLKADKKRKKEEPAGVAESKTLRFEEIKKCNLIVSFK